MLTLTLCHPARGSTEQVLFVGQDEAGHWLVQDVVGLMEGRFISRMAAMSFARSEAAGLGGISVVSAAHALQPRISFAPPAESERVNLRATVDEAPNDLVTTPLAVASRASRFDDKRAA